VTLGDVPARVAFASSSRLIVTVPGELEGGQKIVKWLVFPGSLANFRQPARGTLQRHVGLKQAPPVRVPQEQATQSLAGGLKILAIPGAQDDLGLRFGLRQRFVQLCARIRQDGLNTLDQAVDFRIANA